MGLTGEKSIATIVRHLNGEKDRSHRWSFHHGCIRMPVLTDYMGIAGLTMNHDDFRVLPAGVEERVDENVTKSQSQALVRVGVEILVMKEDDAVVQKRLTNLRDSRVAEIGAQVDIGKFSANGAGKRRYAKVIAGDGLAHHDFFIIRTLLSPRQGISRLGFQPTTVGSNLIGKHRSRPPSHSKTSRWRLVD